MKNLHPLFFIGAGALVLVAAMALRSASGPRPSPGSGSGAVSTTSESAVPAFTSARFADGDALSGLGPEWTYLWQKELGATDGSGIAGTTPKRQSLVKRSGQSALLLLTELEIADQTKLDKALRDTTVSATTVAGRDGYLIPIASLTGGTALLLKGATSVLLIEYGEETYGNMLPWPATIPSDVESYVASVRIP